MKKKDVLVVFAIVTALLLFTAVGVEAMQAFVEFSGPYTLDEVAAELQIDPADVLEDVPDIFVCQTEPLTYGYGDGDPIEAIASKRWFFHAGQDLPDFEIFSAVYVLNLGQYDQFYDTVTMDDPNNPKYLHFSGGQGIPFCYYFDITATLFTTVGEPLPLEFPEEIFLHPTPIPGALWLLGSGLIALVGVRRRFHKKD